ncbi:hypothetical protein KQX54_001620 [Cotesia glomerata]|uniref:Uncharacterized protein n=1 Tax=Cotesia glomerata TaxID=32391 RepID=A0AAV7HU12_COTGL|nr:hypothetical protein KQX54_001620 [Cotesia glomerata]
MSVYDSRTIEMDSMKTSDCDSKIDSINNIMSPFPVLTLVPYSSPFASSSPSSSSSSSPYLPIQLNNVNFQEYTYCNQTQETVITTDIDYQDLDYDILSLLVEKNNEQLTPSAIVQFSCDLLSPQHEQQTTTAIDAHHNLNYHIDLIKEGDNNQISISDNTMYSAEVDIPSESPNKKADIFTYEKTLSYTEEEIITDFSLSTPSNIQQDFDATMTPSIDTTTAAATTNTEEEIITDFDATTTPSIDTTTAVATTNTEEEIITDFSLSTPPNIQQDFDATTTTSPLYNEEKTHQHEVITDLNTLMLSSISNSNPLKRKHLDDSNDVENIKLVKTHILNGVHNMNSPVIINDLLLVEPEILMKSLDMTDAFDIVKDFLPKENNYNALLRIVPP